jgi:rSAM/selenodomain-associated transferase 2
MTRPQPHPKLQIRPAISVVIPTLNEERLIGRTLDSIPNDPALEVIVADGGSADGTAAIAELHGARVLHAPRGRAAQMNAGAAEAIGDVLLFLHADTLLPANFAGLVMGALIPPGIVGGAFLFHLDARHPLLRVIEWGVNLRTRRLNLPYGDQAIFVRAGAFKAIGGFPEWPIMEDVELVRAMKRLGRLGIAEGRAVTSARRWRSVGIVRLTLLHWTALLLFTAGVDPGRIHDRLRRWGYDASVDPIASDPPIHDRSSSP